MTPREQLVYAIKERGYCTDYNPIEDHVIWTLNLGKVDLDVEKHNTPIISASYLEGGHWERRDLTDQNCLEWLVLIREEV